MKPVKMLVVVRNKNINPSSFYRIVQYLKDLDYQDKYVLSMVNDKIYILSLKKNIFINIFFKIISYLIMIKQFIKIFIISKRNKGIVIYIQRETIPRYLPVFLSKLLENIYKNNYIIWDFDDDIFLQNEISKRERALLSDFANVITVTSTYLKKLLSIEAQEKVILMPTTDGSIKGLTEKIEKNRLLAYSKKINLIWLGSRATIFNLKNIIHFLDNAAKILYERYGKILYLYNVSDEKIFVDTQYLKIKNVTWARERYSSILNQAHIGLMPLQNNEYSKGKGGFKIIQYFSSGIPVVASAVGYNLEIVDKNSGFLIESANNSEWISAIVNLSTDIEIYQKMSHYNRNKWENSFSYNSNLKKLNNILLNSKVGENRCL